MTFITRQSQANEVCARWSAQYPDSKKDILKKLESLGPVKNPDDVDRIIGNDSWTTVHSCSECGSRDNDFVVMVGEEPDYESSTAWLCKDCIEKLQTFVL